MADTANPTKQKSAGRVPSANAIPVANPAENAGAASVRAAKVPSGQASEGAPLINTKPEEALDPDKTSGFGQQSPEQRAGAEDHHAAKGDAKDSEYGAAPLRDALYRDGTSGTYGQGRPRASEAEASREEYRLKPVFKKTDHRRSPHGKIE